MTMLTNQTMVLGRDAGGRDCWSATYTERGCFHSFNRIPKLAKSAMKLLTIIFEGSRQLDLWFWRQLPSGRPTSNCQPCLSARQPVVERGNGNKKTIKDTTVFQHIFDIWAKTTRKKGMQILSHYYDTPMKQCEVQERNYDHLRLQSNHENIIMNHISESGLRRRGR